jgi:hypothetical protein
MRTARRIVRRVETERRGASARPDASDLAPAPGWIGVVELAIDIARACEPPAAFRCTSAYGRLAWRDVQGSDAFRERLWALEELSAMLCELCGAPGTTRETWGGAVRTLCPAHAVDVASAGDLVDSLYDRAWAEHAPGARRTTVAPADRAASTHTGAGAEG